MTLPEFDIPFLVCLSLWLESRSAREASHHPEFMDNCQTISQAFYSPFCPLDEDLFIYLLIYLLICLFIRIVQS